MPHAPDPRTLQIDSSEDACAMAQASGRLAHYATLMGASEEARELYLARAVEWGRRWAIRRERELSC